MHPTEHVDYKSWKRFFDRRKKAEAIEREIQKRLARLINYLSNPNFQWDVYEKMEAQLDALLWSTMDA